MKSTIEIVNAVAIIINQMDRDELHFLRNSLSDDAKSLLVSLNRQAVNYHLERVIQETIDEFKRSLNNVNFDAIVGNYEDEISVDFTTYNRSVEVEIDCSNMREAIVTDCENKFEDIVNEFQIPDFNEYWERYDLTLHSTMYGKEESL